MTMTQLIEQGKYVELTYKVIDKKSGSVLTLVEFPLGYVHGANEALSPDGNGGVGRAIGG